MSIVAKGGIEVYENDVDLYLREYERDKDIDCHNISQNRWNSVLLYIYKHVFKNPDPKSKRNSNVDYYSFDIVSDVCDLYINLCYEYEKEISILGFSKLTGISPDTIYGWNNGDRREYVYRDKEGNVIRNFTGWKLNHPEAEYSKELGSPYAEIYKRLSGEREESLSNKLVSGKGNPVGILGVLNRNYGWNMGQPRGIDAGNKVSRTPEQIAADYPIQIEQKQEEIKPDF